MESWKKYRFKKDTFLYHPHLILVPKDTILYSTAEPIIHTEHKLIMTKKEQIEEHMEEVK